MIIDNILSFPLNNEKQSNMRRGRRGTEDSIDAVEEKAEPEFARLKLKKTGSTARSIDEKETEDASSELRKKLMKQKSVADGISGKVNITLRTTDIIRHLNYSTTFFKYVNIEQCFMKLSTKEIFQVARIHTL